jgi:tyrosine-protein kinase Etk/Wzc
MIDKEQLFDEIGKNGEATFEKLNRDVIKEYLNVIRQNIIPIILIFIAAIIITSIYVLNSIDIYRATTVIKIDPPQGNILQSSFTELESQQDDRYIQNQIEVLRSYNIRDSVATILIDTVKKIRDKSYLNFLVNKNLPDTPVISHENLRKRLLGMVSFSQRKGLDAVDISAEGASFPELQLITNVYANVYLKNNLELSREDIKNVKNFLESEKEKKFGDLNIAENNLEDFQQRTGLVQLDEQASNLVNKLSDYDAAKNSLEIDLKAGERTLSSLRNEAAQTDPNLVNYVQSEVEKYYLEELQRQIATIEVQRDIELATVTEPKVRERIISDADKKLAPLKAKLDDQIGILTRGVLSETPQERKSLAARILDASLNTQALRTKLGTVGGVLGRYEAEFSKLPSQSIELAKIQRTRNSTEKLYLILEEKYQEAIINERARLGNVIILDPGIDNYGPVKPDRPRIMLTGAVIGLVLGLVFAFVRNYFDRTIKTPDDIENKGATVLAWIPNIETLTERGDNESEFVVALKPSSAVSEAFKALRTRIQFSKLESDPLKTILVTSSIPSEGKTFVSINLAGSFAHAGKKVLLLDCDLRKPKIHTFFKADRYPGLSDYLFNEMTLDDIIRPTNLENMYYMTSGTIPPNPSELLGSQQMKNFLERLKERFDMIIIDSPPFITVTDSEILFNITDGTVLIAQANKSPVEAFWKTYQRIYSKNPHNLLGCILNNFVYKSSYGYYYNYYYYYSRPEENAKRK